MMARVRGVMAASRSSGSMQYDTGSMSINTGVAPTAVIASAVAIKVCATVITSSPGCSPSAANTIWRAAVPVLTAMQCSVPQ